MRILTGASSVSSDGLFKDLDVTRVEGTVHEFRSMDVTRTTISNLDGRAIAADRGRVSWMFLVDTHQVVLTRMTTSCWTRRS